MNHERACPFSLLIPAFQGAPQEYDSGTHLCTELLVEHVPTQRWSLPRLEPKSYYYWSRY